LWNNVLCSNCLCGRLKTITFEHRSTSFVQKIDRWCLSLIALDYCLTCATTQFSNCVILAEVVAPYAVYLILSSIVLVLVVGDYGLLHSASCGFQGVMRPWCDFWFLRTINIVCLFMSYASPLSLLSSLFPYLSPPFFFESRHAVFPG